MWLGAFGAGALTSLAPCSLVTVPLLVGSAAGLTKDLPPSRRFGFTVLFSFLFALGVIISFSILAFLVAKLGFFFSVAPFWAYVLAGVLALLFGLYSLGVLGELNKTALFGRLIKLRYVGIFLVGVVFGLVSTPCASAPLVAIISLASTLGGAQAYGLVLVFALGHSLLLLFAGVCVGFTQRIAQNKALNHFSSLLTRFFALMLLGIGAYLLYQGWLQW